MECHLDFRPCDAGAQRSLHTAARRMFSRGIQSRRGTVSACFAPKEIPMASTNIDAGDDLPLTIPAVLRQQAVRRGARVLVVCDDARLSYTEADERSRRLARGLLAAGATKGSHIALLYPNGPDFMVGFLAAASIGAVAVPLST